MLKFEFEISFPNCEHKESKTLTSRDKRGIERFYQKIIEEQKGLCGSCYRTSIKMRNNGRITQ